MIVQCEGCKTRFRIADDKVSGRGVRVRCTRCKETFVVRPPDASEEAKAARPPKAGSAPQPSPAVSSSPAADAGETTSGAESRSANASTSEKESTSANDSSLASALGLDLDGLLGEDFDLDLPPPASDEEAAAETDGDAGAEGDADGLGDLDASFGDDAGKWTVEKDDAPGADDSSDDESQPHAAFDGLGLGDDASESASSESASSEPPGSAEIPSGAGHEAPPEAPSPTEEDVDAAMAAFDLAFDGNDSEAATSDGPVSAPEPKPGLDADAGPDSDVDMRPGLDADPAAESGPATDGDSAASPDPAAEPDVDPFPGWGTPSTDAAPDDGPSAWGDPETPAAGPETPQGGSETPAANPDSGGWQLDLEAEPSENAPAAASDAAEGDGSGLDGDGPPGLDLDGPPGLDLGGPPGLDLDAPAVALGSSGSEAGPAPSAEGNLAVDLGEDDPFASLDVGASQDAGFEPQDLPALPEPESRPEASNVPATDKAAAQPVARIGLVSASQAEQADGKSRTEKGAEDKGAPKRRIPVASIVTNGIFAAAVLAVALFAFVTLRTPGPLDATVLSPDRMAQAFSGRAGQGVVVAEMVSGVYPTRTGEEILYVRGELANLGEAASAGLGVVARIVDRDGAVRQTAPGIVGAVPTAEDLWRLEGPGAIAGLRARLLTAEAPSIAAGERTPFFVAFEERPADLSAVRFEVEITDGRAVTIARPEPVDDGATPAGDGAAQEESEGAP